MRPPGNAHAEEELFSPPGSVPRILPLVEDEIHLWRAPLDISEEALCVFEKILSPDESERAGRFRFPEHRKRFIAARGILRNILGIHLDCAPVELDFAYSEYGKPRLAGLEDTQVEFNLSHSADLALYAVTFARPVGVDVEFIKANGSWLRIAEHYFTPVEFSMLSNLPEEEMRREFFALWSEKEARLKALGVGLRYPLGDGGDDSAWSVERLKPMPGYCGALAFASRDTDPLIIRHHFEI